MIFLHSKANIYIMYTAIKGIYEDGVLKLLEPAPNIKKSKVVITFLSDQKESIETPRQPGGLLKLKKNEGKRLDIPNNFNDLLEDLDDYM